MKMVGALVSNTFTFSMQLYSVVLSTQGSFYNESTIVSAPDSEDGTHLCRCLTPLTLTRIPKYAYWLNRK